MQDDDMKEFPGEACGVSEKDFPLAGTCCHQRVAPFMATYVSDCPHCRISTSLPYGTGMKTVTIFECEKLGYGRRITE